MESHGAHPGGQVGVGGDDHAALTGGHGLGGVEAVDRRFVAVGADQFSLVQGRERVGGVLDDLQAVAFGEPREGPVGYCEPGEVHRGDGDGAVGDLAFRILQVDAQGSGIDVDQDRVAAEVAHRLGGGGERPRGNQHLGSGTHPDGLEGQVQARGGRVDRHPVGVGAQELDELLLEGGRVRAGRQPSGTHGLDDGLDLGLGDVWARERKESHGREPTRARPGHACPCSSTTARGSLNR